MLLSSLLAQANPSLWKIEWPNTDFSKASVPFDEIESGGPPKDGIPAIDNPNFVPIGKVKDIDKKEPTIVVSMNNVARVYPIRIMMFHEIVNDTIGDTPIAITYCPLCNSSVVFDRRVGDKILSFGTTGKLRHSDLIMYDRQTESWWQQFTGEGIVGHYTGAELKTFTYQMIPYSLAKKRFPKAEVLVPSPDYPASYGSNPYVSYDTAEKPFRYKGAFDEKISPMAYVVAVGKDAWPLALVRERGFISYKGILIEWSGGMSSALDKAEIKQGRDIGSVSVTKEVDGKRVPINYKVPFAFAFKAFHKDGVIHQD